MFTIFLVRLFISDTRKLFNTYSYRYIEVMKITRSKDAKAQLRELRNDLK